MKESAFLWHAKRGHGESIIELKNENLNENFDAVKQIILNNYAFLKRNEYRSSYAYELASYYKRNEYFTELLLNKLKETKLEDDYTYVYLTDTLYFFSKNEINIRNKLVKILDENLNKQNYSINESSSIESLISLIFDLYKEKNDIIAMINKYYSFESESTLDLSMIMHNYDIEFKRKKINHIEDRINLDSIKDSFQVIDFIQKDKSLNYNLPLLSNYLSKKTIYDLVENLVEIPLDKKLKNNILKLIFYSGLCNVKLMKKILLEFNKNDIEFDSYLLEMACTLKSKTIKQFGLSLLDTEYISYGIRIILKNYCLDDYNIIKDYIKQLKIDYKDNKQWFEIEESLISYFNKKKIDLRLLNEVKFFMKNGLSSTSRYKLVKILLKYKALDDIEIYYLKLDANVDIRKLLKN